MALSGLLVLDLSRLLPGPFATMLLADLGADVVKIEEVGRGDYLRSWGPFLPGTKTSGYHAVLNRNKRSVTLNLKDEKGRDILRQLAAKADVLIEGFRPGMLESLGVGQETLRKLNPRLVTCSITGFGSDSPEEVRGRAAHDLNSLALGGVLSFNGDADRPVPAAVQLADIGAGFLAAFSIVCALFSRERNGGKGQNVDISMLDAGLMFSVLRWGRMLGDHTVPSTGDDMLSGGFACYGLYETKDHRWMSVGALEPHFWKAFCTTIEHPEWNDPSYFIPGAHQATLRDQVSSVFMQRTQQDWATTFSKIDCCVEPVLNLDEVARSEVIRSRKMVVDLVSARWGAYSQLGCAARLSANPPELRTPAPELGEHTDQFLAQQLGLKPPEIKELHDSKAI